MNNCPNIDELNQLVILTIEEMRGLLPGMPTVISSDTSLIEPLGFMDSIALFSFQVALEEQLEEKYGVVLSLSDIGHNDAEYHAFKNIQGVSTYLLSRLQR